MRNPVEVRKAYRADAGLLALVDGRCFSNPWSSADFHNVLAYPNTHALLAWIRATPVGACVHQVVGDRVHVVNVCVDPRWRRQGIGMGLLAVVGEQARRWEASGLAGFVDETNLGGQLFLKACGWRAVRTLPADQERNFEFPQYRFEASVPAWKREGAFA